MPAPTGPFLPIVEVIPIEPNLTWEEFCSDPLKLFKSFSEHFAVEAKILQSSTPTYSSPDTPPPEERSKLWIKTSWPYGIGYLIGGEYQMDYGMSKYPVGIPFLERDINLTPAKDYITKMNADEIQQGGLWATGSSGVNKYNWYIFQPPTITI